MDKSESRDIAIIGMSGIFPGAKSIEQFRENLINGVYSVVDLSDERIINTTIANNIDYRKSGFLREIDNFDHDLFGISYAEAKNMDPHQRKILEQTYSAIENAGYNYEDLSGTNTSVYLSDVELKYYELAEKFDPTLVSGNLNACTAGRISRFFNFRGAAAMVDTSCSSSMVALNMACNDLILSDAEYALVGGAQISVFPTMKNFEGDIGIVSEDSMVRPFAKGANGTVFSEAVVCFLLKKLNNALKDKDNILAIIKAVSVNQDAQSSASLTSPSVLAQSDVLTQSWKKAGISPKDLLYLETHGTGTLLGDPIEIDGIQKAIDGFGESDIKILIGSVKSNVGHTVGVAGATGLAKVVLILKNRELYPSINFDSPNPLINFAQSNLTVCTEYQKIEQETEKPIIAGISSFGLSGTNTHVVVEEWIDKNVKSKKDKQAYTYCLSARNEEVLKNNIISFKESIGEIKKENSVDVNYTLLTGRKHFPYRVVLSENLDVKFETRKVKEFIKSFILITPFHKIENHWIDFFKSRFNFFSETFENCQILGDHVKDKDRLIHFCFQYAQFLFLKEIGIDAKNLIGFGDGKLVTGIVSGKYSIKEAINLLNEDELLTYDELLRLQKFFEKEKDHGNLAFFEVGGFTEITKPFTTLLNETKEATLFTCINQDQNSWDNFIELLFVTGYNINWKKYFELELFDHKKVALPGYQFNETRCWIKEVQKDDFSNLIDKPIKMFKWREENLEMEQHLSNTEQYILLGDESEERDEIIREFNRREMTLITFGLDDFDRWLNERSGENFLQKVIVMCLIPYESITSVCEESNSITNYKLRLLQRILEHEEKVSKIVFINECFKKNIVELLSGSTILAADTLLKTAFHEYKKIGFKNIHWYPGTSAEKILDEVFVFNRSITTVYGDDKRYVPSLEKLTINKKNQEIITNGEYVIIGGAKGIGNEIALSIAKKNNVSFSIIGRSSVDDNLVEIGLNRLKDQGSEVSYYQADVSIENKLLEVLSEIGANKKINGIVFSAGQSEIKLLKELTYKETIEQAKSKIYGIQGVAAFINKNQLDFVVVFSSILAITSSPGYFSYAYSNAYLNDFLGKKTLNKPIKVINWCGWNNTGLLKNNLIKKNYLLDIQEGVNLFWRLLELEGSEFFISKENGIHEYSSFFKNYIEDSNQKLKKTEEFVFHDYSIEEILTKEICNILGLIKISLDEDYFDLGLHSLNGAQLISSLKANFGLELEFYDLYNYPTISQLSDAVKKVFPKVELVNFETDQEVIGDNEKYDLSPSQLRVWLSEQIQHTNLYNLPGELILEGDFDKDICEKALGLLIDYQPALKTIFFVENGIPKQKILPKIDFEIQYEDISFLDQEEKKQQIDISIFENRNQRFNLNGGLLFRFGIFKLSEKKYLLTFCVHHIISDVWSVKLFQNLFLTTYKSLKEGKEICFDSKILNFPQYAKLLNQRLTSQKYNKSKIFFSNEIQLCYKNPLKLKYDFLIDKRSSNKASAISTDFIVGLDQLKKLANKNKVSVFMFVITALKCLLKNWTGGNIIPIGVPEIGRYTKEEEKTIGYFVKEFPFVTSIDEDEVFSELLKKIKAKFQTLMEHKEYPVEGLYYEEIKKFKKEANKQVYDVLFTWNQFDENEDGLWDTMNLKAQTIPYTFESSNYNIWFLTNLYSDRLEINLIYSEELFKAKTAMNLLNSIKEILTQVITDINIPIKFLENSFLHSGISFEEGSTIELYLQAIWKQVLEIENINVKNEFFEIGGNKEKAEKIILQINNKFRIQMKMKDFLDSTTISGLEAQISFLLKQKEIILNDKNLIQREI